MSNDQRPTIYGDGTQSRDFTYVSNVVEGNILAATKELETPIVMNCATHGQVTVNELVEEINKLVSKNIKPIYDKPRPGEILHSFAEISLIKNKLSFTPEKGFIQGLQFTIHSMKQ